MHRRFWELTCSCESKKDGSKLTEILFRLTIAQGGAMKRGMGEMHRDLRFIAEVKDGSKVFAC